MKLFLIILVAMLSGATVLCPQAEGKVWYVYVDDMPKHWEEKFSTVITDATKYWEERLPDTQFHFVSFPEQAEFVVQWASQYIGTKLGYYTPDTKNDYGRPYIAITLGYMDEELPKGQVRKFNLVNAEYATEITKHEIGHAIGFLHSEDPNDIMYPKIYDYQRWLENKTSQPKSENIINLTDWEKESLKYQKWTGYKLTVLKSGIDFAEILVEDKTNFQASIGKASSALWNAKKIYSESELMQKEGNQLMSQDKFEQAFNKYQNSFNHAEKISSYLFEIAVYLNLIN